MAVAFALYTASVAIAFWPGQMDPDTIDELQSAATGQFNNWHTPLLSALWRGPYLLGLRSPGWVLAISVFSMLVGFYLLLRVRFRRAASAVIAIAVLHVATRALMGRSRRAGYLVHRPPHVRVRLHGAAHANGPEPEQTESGGVPHLRLPVCCDVGDRPRTTARPLLPNRFHCAPSPDSAPRFYRRRRRSGRVHHESTAPRRD